MTNRQSDKRHLSPFHRQAGSPFVLDRVQADGRVNRSIESMLQSIGLARATLGGRDEVESPMQDSWVVYACITALSEAVRQVPMNIWSSTDEDAAEVPQGHPLRQLFAAPNPDMGLSDLLSAGIIHRKLTGEDWWFLMDSNGLPVTPSTDQRSKIPLPTVIVPVPGDFVEDERDQRTGRISTVQYSARGVNPPVFGMGSIVHFLDYNPSDSQRGLAASEVALRIISVGFQTERYQESVMRGGGPGAFLNYEEEMSNDEESRLQDSVNEAVRDPDIIGGYKVVTGKVNIIPNPATPKEMMQRDTLDWVRDTVCAVFQVPPPVIGNYDTATYNNVTEAYRQFWAGVRGYLDTVAEKINTHFIQRLEDPRLAACRVSFDYSNIVPLQADNSAQFKLAAELASRGVGLSFNDAAKLIGLELDPIETANTVFQPMSSMPYAINDAATGDTAQVMPATSPDQAAEAPEASVPDAAAKQPSVGEGLNGAQVQSLLLIITQGATGNLTADSGVALIMAAFPSITEQQAREILGGAKAPVTEPLPAPQERKQRKMDTREARAAFNDAIVKRRLDPGERRMATDILGWLRRYEKAQRDLLEKVAREGVPGQKAWTQQEVEDFLLLKEEEWAKALAELSSSHIEEMIKAGIADAVQMVPSIQLTASDPRMLRIIATQQAKLAEGVSSRLAQEVRDTLLQTLGKPTSTGTLQAQLQEVLPELDEDLQRVFGNKEARALTIARTETAKAYNTSQAEAYKEGGVEKVQWVASNDAATRPSHLELDGEVRAIGEPFKPDLRFPGDPEGEAEEVINCRCTLAPIVV